MSKGFSAEFIQKLKDKNNISDIVSKYVRLDRKGRNLWACCPFHHEKTPSFTVNEESQFFHCFGCGKGGDIITFIRDIESVEYVDAVKILAERAQIELPDVDYDDKELKAARRRKEKALEILKETARFYAANLNSGECDKHVEYILNRRISSQTVRRHGIGASKDFDGLPKYLFSKGYTENEIVDCGVCEFKKNGGVYDSLGGRLIFPIINAFGDVLAFGGRLMEKTDFAKYKNTRETFLFSKSKNLYNINLVKREKQERGLSSVIVVEGYMDTISLYQAGFKNVTASMGTSLTKDQARLLKRYSDNIYISYDGDAAGAKATLRGLDILESESLNVKVIELPEGQDPDDVIKQNGAEFYKNLMLEALPLNDYKLSLVRKKYDLKDAGGKRSYVAQMLEIIRTVNSASVREEYLKKLRDDTGLTYESLKRDLESAKIAQSPDKTTDLPLKNEDSLVTAQRFIVASFAFSKKYANDFDIKSIDFDNNVHNEIIKEIIKQNAQGQVSVSMLYEMDFDEAEINELNAVLGFGLGELMSGEKAEKFFNDCVKFLKTDKLQKELGILESQAENENDIKERRNLIMLIQKKTDELKALMY